MANIRLFQRCD